MTVLCRAVLISLCAVLISACAVPGGGKKKPEPTGIMIQGIVIRNQLAFPVTDVMILVPATGNYAGCGNILGGSDCRTTIEAVDYYANAVVISWKEYGQPHQTDEFVIRDPDHLVPDKPAWLEVIIFAMGQAGAKLTQ